MKTLNGMATVGRAARGRRPAAETQNDAERALLAAILTGGDVLAQVRGLVAPVDFADDAIRTLYAFACELADDGRPIDGVTLKEAAFEAGLTLAELGELIAARDFEAAHAAEYARQVLAASRRRRLIEVAGRLHRAAEEGDDAGAVLAAEWAALEGLRDGSTVQRGAVLDCMNDIEARAIRWLWPNRIPLGRLSLLVGVPGGGKSFLTADWAARVTTGTQWPDGERCEKGDVLLLAAEDDPADTIRPRLDAHRADCGRVHLLRAVRRPDGERLITLADVDAIEDTLRRLPQCRLVVIDPVGSFLGGRVDSHRDNEVRSVLAPIARLAEKYNVAVVIVAHRRKSQGGTADDSAMGSRAFTGIARAVWHVLRHPTEKRQRLLLAGKTNLAAEPDGLAFEIGGEPARVRWHDAAVTDLRADDALAAEQAPKKPGPEADALPAAVTWLRSALVGGARPSEELFDEWANGQGGSKRTLIRAKDTIGAEAFREKVPGPWLWRCKNAKPS